MMGVLRAEWEIVVVDDGSRPECAARLALLDGALDGRVRLITHARNTGRGRAVADGIRASRGRLCGFLDADLEVGAHYLPAMIAALEAGADVATVDRSYVLRFNRTMVFRHVLSSGYRRLERRVLGMPFRDTAAGYKFFRRDAVLPILDRVVSERWFWDTEVMYQAQRAGLRVFEVPALFVWNQSHTSTVRIVSTVTEYLQGLLRLSAGARADVPADAREVEAFYDRFWSSAGPRMRGDYDTHGFLAPARQWLLDRAGDLRGRRCLEIGAGDGRAAAEMINRGADVVTVDVSREATSRLEEERARSADPSRWEVRQGDARALPFDAASFDFAYAQNLLMHVDPGAVFAETRRVLRRGGRAAFLEPLAGHPGSGAYRKLHPTFAETRPRYLRQAELDRLGGCFDAFAHREFFLVSPLLFGQPSLQALHDLDDRLLAAFPRLRRFAWISAMEGRVRE